MSSTPHLHHDGPLLLPPSISPTTSPTPAPPFHKCALHHPNPRPGPHPDFSSLEHLRHYINDEIQAFRRALNDPDNDYWREEHHAEQEHRARSQQAVASPNAASASTSTSQSQPQSSSTSAPSTQDTPTTSQPPTQDRLQSVAEESLPAPLDPATRAEIEAFIPATILRLPLAMRTIGLRAWFTYLYQSQHEAWGTLLPPQRRRKITDGAVVPWDRTLPAWEGSFDAGATEVVECACEDGRGRKVVKVERREVDVKVRGSGKEGAGLCGRSVGRGEVLEMEEGHVLGRDWAAGKGGKAVVVYEERGKEERGRQDSVLERMAGFLKRVVSS